MNTFVRASPTSGNSKKRKLKKFIDILKIILVGTIVIMAVGYVGQSDFDTHQEECKAGLRSCR